MAKPTLLIPHDFDFRKYHPDPDDLPYEATGAKLRDEIGKRTDALEVVRARDEKETLSVIEGSDFLVAYGVTAAALERAARLKWIQSGSAGIDHFFKSSDVDGEWLRARGIMLSKASGVTRLVIGEQVLAYMLMFMRDMPRALRQQMRGRWEIFPANQLAGKTVAIVGLGGIGGRVVELSKAFGCTVIGTKRDPVTYRGPADEVLPPTALERLLPRADFVVLACSLNEETRDLINARSLALMKPTAYLINIARGELIVHDDLVQALRSGVIAGAGLDTFGSAGSGQTGKEIEVLSASSPLWELENVIITPNHASATPRIYEYLAEIVVDGTRRIAAGEDPANRVV